MIANEQHPQQQAGRVLALAPSGPKSPDSVAPQVRPWVRYWARMFDIYLTGLVLGVVLGIFSPHVLNVPGSTILLGLAILLMWVFIESLLLSSLGVTPGKWLLNIRLVPPSGERASFTTALSRSVKVWWRGLGVGLPIISIVTLVIARADLKETGSTTWDKDTGFAVVHGRIGLLRAMVVVVSFCLFIALVIVGSIGNA